MIYIAKENESFDAEILRQELVKAIGAEGWYINTAGNTVTLETIMPFDLIGGAGQAAEATIFAHFANGETRTHNKAILAQITALEATQTPRRVREGGTWLAELDAKIAALRSQLL